MRVLLAEDDAVARMKMERMLTKWGYEVVSVKEGPAALAILRGPDPPSLALLDWMMPKLDGMAVCRLIRKRQGALHTYVIMLTARGGAQDVYEAVESGADDYLVKPVVPDYLRSRLKIAHKVLDLQQQMASAREQMRQSTVIDAASGLIDRAGITTMLSHELLRTRHAGTPVGVVMAEVDHFRNLSETHGRPGANAVLREIARRLQSALRDSDKLGALDAGEFLIIAPACSNGRAGQLAERLRQCVAAPIAIQLPEKDPVEVPVSLSVTLSLGAFDVRSAAEADTTLVLSELQKTVQQAKREGFDRVCVVGGGPASSPSPSTPVERQESPQSTLEPALEPEAVA